MRKKSKIYIIIGALALCLTVSSFITVFIIINGKTNNNIPYQPKSYSRIWNKGSGGETGKSIALDSFGNIYVAGNNYPDYGLTGCLLVKYDSNGIQQWNTTWNGSFSLNVYGESIDSANNIYITGYLYNGTNHGDIFLVKFNSAGVKQWDVTWGGTSFDTGYSLAIDSSDNIFLAGSTASYGHNNTDVFLAKFNSSGGLQWNITWGGSGFDSGNGITIDSSDNIYITGSTSSYGSGGADVLLVKFNSTGTEQWNTTWGGSDSDVGNSIVLDGNDNIYVAGTTKSYGLSFSEVLLIKFNNIGELQWNTTWNHTNLDVIYSIANSVDIDSSGNVYMTGFTSFRDENCYSFVVKYNSEGIQQWYINWGNLAIVEGNCLKLDSNGNIYVTGWRDEDLQESELFLLKYNNISIQKWAQQWNSSRKAFLMDNSYLYQIFSTDTNGKMNLRWDPVQNASSYDIYRSNHIITKTTGMKPIKSVTEAYFTDSVLKNGTYFYVITAITPTGESQPSNYQSINVEIQIQKTQNKFLDEMIGLYFSLAGISICVLDMVIQVRKRRNTPINQ